MIPRAFDSAAAWWLGLAGWSVVVALWHTSVVALALATWRLWHRTASARSQYLTACVALGVATLLTVATPIALRWPPARDATTALRRPGGEAPLASSPTGAMRPAASASWAPGAVSIANRAAPWLGALWCVGVLASLLRFTGGWALAQRIRRRSMRLDAPHLSEAVAEASARWGLPPAALFASAHVDAPVVIGARAPAILLPLDLEQHLDPEALPTLLAHELAHVARRDYVANLAQSIADAVLWFSPGAHWISRRVREAREYCCDDLVVAGCGPRPYVEALTTLAGLGAAARARPVLNVAGPRLIVRVRRLLQEDAMIPFTRVRVTGWIAGLAVAVATGLAVVPLAARQVAASPAAQASTSGRISFAFVTRQPGSSVTLRSVVESPAGLCGTAVVHNDADRAITQLQFIGIVTAVGGRPSSVLGLSDPLDVRVESGKEATISPNLMPASEARWRMASGQVQVTCGLVYVQFDNGYRWYVTPNAAAATADEILGLPPAEIPRALIGTPGANPNLCFDELGRESSPGAVIAIRHEPGRFARCEAGAWLDYVLPGAPPAVP